MNNENSDEGERLRLHALRELEILDTENEPEFDQIIQLASSICNTPISLITLIDENRQWFKAKTGLALNETHRDFAFCAHAIHQDGMMVVEDALLDKRFVNNPFVTGDPNIRFYAGMPLVTNAGYKLGTLCVIDREPRTLSAQQQLALSTLAKQVSIQFELRLKVKQLNAAIKTVHEQRNELERLNLISNRLLSIIGHDLRSPLSSLSSLLELFKNGNIGFNDFLDMNNQLYGVVQSAESLLNNLLVWGTAQLKGDEVIHVPIALHGLVDMVVTQNKPYFDKKGNEVIIRMREDFVVKSDKNILEFVLRNLLMNANKFSDQKMITVHTTLTTSEVQIHVTDQGIGIETERIEKLFTWEKRRSTPGTSGETGSGIGLKLCAELIERLQGRLEVSSVLGKGSTFTIKLPLLS